MTSTEYDVIVVGGGVAGLSAALVLCRARRRVLVVDAGHPRNAASGHVHGFLSQDGTQPEQLIAEGRREVLSYGGEIVAGAVSSVDAGLRVSLDNGASMTCRRLLIATGLRDELPDIPGVAQRWGRDVLHCPYCHGFEVRDQRIGVLGGHFGSVFQALMVRELSEQVTFIHPEVADDDREQLEAFGVAVTVGRPAAVVVEADSVTGLDLADGRRIRLSAVFIAPRKVPNDQLLNALGTEMKTSPLGVWPVCDATGRTSVSRVWAAGNAADPTAQVARSVASGADAAFAINEDLLTEDVASAVAALQTGRRR